MKIDVRDLRRKIVGAVGRFPFPFVAAATATAAIVVRSQPARWHEDAAEEILAAAAVGFPLLLSVALFAERRGWPREKAVFYNVMALVLLVAYALGLPANLAGIDLLRISLHGLAAVLLVMLVPFAVRGEDGAFWSYNRALAVRALVAAFLTQTLFAGAAAALAGIDYLFGISVPASIYLSLWAVVSVLGGAVAFLRGVPERPWERNAVDYPRRLGLFNRFILVPLVVVYLVILYLYAAKIVVQATWPKGGVAGFVLGFSAAGILAYVLLAPVREKAEGRLVPLFARWFFPVVLPLAVLLLLSVWRRIAEYGVTESRYFGVVAALWLAALGACFTARRAGIKAIPASLAAVALLSSFGPWGAAAVSQRSQAARLERLLARNGLLAGGRVTKAPGPVPPGEAAEISRTVRYLADRRGLGRISPWFGADLGAAPPENVVGRLGLRYNPYGVRRSGDAGERLFAFLADRTDPLRVGGYDYYMRLDTTPGDDEFAGGSRRGVSPGGAGAARLPIALLVLDAKTGRLSLETGGEAVATADLVPLVRTLLDERPEGDTDDSGITVPREKMTLAAQGGSAKAKIVIAELYGAERNGRIAVHRVKADVLLRGKR